MSKASGAGHSANAADLITIPYASIIRLIPNELWGKLAPAGVAGFNFTISKSAALAQLSNGAVKVKFGEVRKGAPAGVFINTPAEDNRLVELPLSEILAQLHPDAYALRPDQGRVSVDTDVPDVFGGQTGPIRVMEKKEIANTTILARQKTPEAGPAPVKTVPSVPPAPTVPAPAIPTNVTQFPNAPTSIPISIPAPAPRPATPPAAAAPFRPPAAAPVAPRPVHGAPTAKTFPKLPTAPVQAPTASGFAPAAPIVPLAGPLAQGSFTIGLDTVAENWPDAVRKELAALKIPDAKIAIPPVDVCEGLKRGRIQYPWRTLRSWIQPTPLYSQPSPNDDLVLELPLRTLTPAFLEFIRANPVNRQTAAAENITEFFRRAEETSAGPDVLQALMEPEPVAPEPSAPIYTPAPPAAVATSGDASVENGCFCIPLGLIAGNWSEVIQQDVAQFGLGGSRIDIPLELLDVGLKSGRLEFAWAEVCAWINPPSKAAQVSINGDQRVSLPLQTIGPLFIKLRPSGNRKRTAVMADIPDLFNAGQRPQSQPPPEPAKAPEAPAAPVSAPAAPAATAAVRPPASTVSELFGDPDKKSWTPNEIVQRSTQLPGVAGALIALQDGLLVASSLPQNLKTEMIAAFVPQIFGRLNQYSKELHLGDATAVGFTIDAGTLQIYNAGIIYFAALSRKGESLPVRDLQLIAAELSRHTK